MLVLFLFKPKVNAHICSYIYTVENDHVVSYSFDEDYIVKTDENAFKDLQYVEDHYSKIIAGMKKDSQPVMVKKEFPDIKAALFYLQGTLDDFNESIPARKRLPQIINPYDMDFDDPADEAAPFKPSSYSYDKDFDGGDDDEDIFDENEDEDFGYDDDEEDGYYK